jgi:hypothetical protein
MQGNAASPLFIFVVQMELQIISMEVRTCLNVVQVILCFRRIRSFEFIILCNGRCTSWTSVFFVPELLLFLLSKVIQQLLCISFLFFSLSFFVLALVFDFLTSSREQLWNWLDGYACTFYFFQVCFRSSSSCWTSRNNCPELLYDMLICC